MKWEISGNTTNAEGIGREQEWIRLQERLHSCFSLINNQSAVLRKGLSADLIPDPSSGTAVSTF